ncbi:DUF1285 domain-containing protein [Pseudogemmobacter faecipullorum]|uniref:DUF1285 domain-containing protein n=1 Tax=Pseudogemmobacter faecipullorum TaxID=2755041 RepID=A0ABS8CNN3_9RHOB|nr:DUF1285 domain-containing protein [Pseudogemmobacter faecipullorum]MCB5411016.1 DUF1285 domain-containing protein [Pseudogemmobacter faecipullorum]
MAQEDAKSPSAEGLAAAASSAAKGGKLPPVHLWNPDFCGDLDIRIARDGTWYYLGSPIGRAPLVKLFSSILKLEAGKYYLVTPVEKVGITVEDAPLHAVDFEVSGQGRDQSLTFTTRTEDVVTAGPGHVLRIVQDPASDAPSPYIMVRAGLEARIDRKSFFRLVDLGCHETHEGDSWFGLWSSGQFFPVIRSSELA